MIIILQLFPGCYNQGKSVYRKTQYQIRVVYIYSQINFLHEINQTESKIIVLYF